MDMMEIRRQVISFDGLPPQYRRYDYLFRSSSYKCPYCKLNYQMHAGDVIKTYTKPVNLSGERAFAGTSTSGLYVEFYYQNNTGSLRVYSNTSSRITGSAQYGDIDILTATVNQDFALWNFGVYRPENYLFNGKLYGMDVHNSAGVLIHKLVPCVRKSDQEPGFYDVVEHVFHTNDGTEDSGEFVPGND